MKVITSTGRILAGIIFIFSGLSKGVDPLGSMYKFIDYFTAFGLDSLNGLALALGIILSCTEFLIGFSLIAGIRNKEASWGLLLMMIGFTPLTLVLAINNPVSDCGCFGDALHMTNWQTFYKNLVILIISIPVFLSRKDVLVKTKSLNEWLVVLSATIVFITFTLLNLRQLPIIDFRPYAEGENISANMEVPEGSQADEYETLLIYEKDGVQEEFTLENYPEDPEWVFVDQKSTLIKKGYTPPIHDFILTNSLGEDYTSLILAEDGYSIVLISKNLNDAHQDDIINGLNICENLVNSGISSYLLTSSSQFEDLLYGYNTTGLYGDETMIKTIVRANPGYILIHNGTIIKKWSANSIPNSEVILEKLEQYKNKKHINIYLKLILIMGIIIFAAVISRYIIKKY